MIDPTVSRFLPGLDIESLKASTGVAHICYGSGEPMLLFHGGAGSWNHWVKNIPVLADRFRVIAIDSPSYGASDAVDREIANDDFLAIVFRTVDEITAGAERVHVAGFSFGGAIASAVTAHLNQRAASLSLTGTAGFKPSPQRRKLPLKSERRLREDLGREPTEQELRELHKTNLGHLMVWDTAKIDDRAVDMQIANVARTRFDSRRISWSGATPDFLAATTCPINIIYGEHDASAFPSIEERVRRCREARPDARHIRLEDCGHWAMYEAPDRINNELLGFHGSV